MRRCTAPAVLLALALAACSPDGARTPLAPSAPNLAAGSRGAAATIAKRIHGTLEAVETGAFQPGSTLIVTHLEGEGAASHLGRYTVVADFTFDLATAAGSGRITFTAANGDSFTATETGQAVDTDGIAQITEAATITGGTGRFAGATGALTIVRRLDQATGRSSGSFDGTIYLAK